MNAIATKLEQPGLPTLDAAPATQLTPMQMAYQLIAKGTEFSAVREMIEFAKKLEADEAEKAFNTAMAAAQADMSVVATNMTNTQTRSKYADYAALDRALRPIYTKHGFALSFNDGSGAPPDWVRIVCHVSNSGHTRIYHKDMPADGKGAKGGDVMTKTHAVGAAQSYAMRYLLRMIFNVAVGEDDKDGNAAVETLSEEQIEQISALIDKAVDSRPGTDRAEWLETFLEYMKAPALNSIPAKDFNKAKTTIQNAIASGAK